MKYQFTLVVANAIIVVPSTASINPSVKLLVELASIAALAAARADASLAATVDLEKSATMRKYDATAATV